MCDTFSSQSLYASGWDRVTSPWNTVRDFEKSVADYASAPYGVAVDSCTNALLLCLLLERLRVGNRHIGLPRFTYVGVAQAVILAGHKCEFNSKDWSGAYLLGGTNIVDSARRFTKNMYEPNMLFCLSFHYAKHLPIGRGGMILTDDKATADTLRRMRYDGRTEGVKTRLDSFDVPGYHCLLEPTDAARGLALMQYIPDHNDDLPNDDYADLSQFTMFSEGI